MKLRCNLGVYLLVLVIEECAEIIQRACKAIRFGMEEKQNTASGKSEADNKTRLQGEMVDFQTVVQKCQHYGLLDFSMGGDLAQQEKHKKIDKYMAYSRECGTLIQETEDDGK